MNTEVRLSALDVALKDIEKLHKRNSELVEALHKWKTKCGTMERFAKINRDDLWYVEYLKDQLRILEELFDGQTVDISRLNAKLNAQRAALESFTVITHSDTL